MSFTVSATTSTVPASVDDARRFPAGSPFPPCLYATDAEYRAAVARYALVQLQSAVLRGAAR